MYAAQQHVFTSSMLLASISSLYQGCLLSCWNLCIVVIALFAAHWLHTYTLLQDVQAACGALTMNINVIPLGTAMSESGDCHPSVAGQ